MSKVQRIGEIDALRGIAILLMIVFHSIVDLRDFFDLNLDYHSGFWYYEGRLAALLFMLLAGVSSQFSGNNFRRGMQVLGAGLLVTAATYWFNPDSYVRFGILQLLGSSMLLQPLVQRQSVAVRLLLALAALAAGPLTASLTLNSSLGLPFGIMPPGFHSIDYYPLLPWYGIFLSGNVIGALLYRERRSLLPRPLPDNLINWLGRHSLAIYLIHQPLLLTALTGLFALLPR